MKRRTKFSILLSLLLIFVFSMNIENVQKSTKKEEKKKKNEVSVVKKETSQIVLNTLVKWKECIITLHKNVRSNFHSYPTIEYYFSTITYIHRNTFRFSRDNILLGNVYIKDTALKRNIIRSMKSIYLIHSVTKLGRT